MGSTIHLALHHPFRMNCFWLIFFWLTTDLGFSQAGNRAFFENTDEVTSRPVYLGVAIGSQYAGFRDFATSPLNYSGNITHVSLSHIDVDRARESSLRLSYSFGQTTSDFNNHKSSSTIKIIALNYLELFEIPVIRSDRINLKMGGQFNALVNIRNNEKLFNNSKGIEGIANLFASIKGSLDLSRRRDKTISFLFTKWKLRKQKRLLSFNLNVGVVNSAFRNGFVYTGHAAILNKDEFFSGYHFRVFAGYRLNSRLDYTIHLSSKNALQLSYLWEVYNTGHLTEFEMYRHTLKLSFLYNIK